MTYEEVKEVMNFERSRSFRGLAIGAELEKLRTRMLHAKADDITLRQHDSESLQAIVARIVTLEEEQEKLLQPDPEFMRLLNLLDDKLDWYILFSYYSNCKSLSEISRSLSGYYEADKHNCFRMRNKAMKKIAAKIKVDYE